MKTKKEIKEEIAELYGASMALSQALETLHQQQMDATKKMFALNQLLKDMEEDEEKDN